jgi:hypothetical protein
MCDDCEQNGSLMVVSSRRLDRRGWRPPAKAATVARHSDVDVPGGPANPSRFSCEPSRPTERRREIR